MRFDAWNDRVEMLLIAGDVLLFVIVGLLLAIFMALFWLFHKGSTRS